MIKTQWLSRLKEALNSCGEYSQSEWKQVISGYQSEKGHFKGGISLLFLMKNTLEMTIQFILQCLPLGQRSRHRLKVTLGALQSSILLFDFNI